MSTGCNNRIFSLTIFTRTQLQQKAAGCFQASRVAKADDKKKNECFKALLWFKNAEYHYVRSHLYKLGSYDRYKWSFNNHHKNGRK